MTITENILLKDHTTFRIGGPARYFVVVKSVEELREAITFAQEKNLAYFVLGGGSNVLISDAGFSGLVIKNEIMGIQENILDTNTTEIIVGAGENWDAFVAYAVSHGLYGIENLSLIPGTVGAAPVQNIGAYGVEIKDTIQWVEVFDAQENMIKKFTNQECEFEYRDSVFKKVEYKKYIITRVCFLLKKNGVVRADYKDIANYIESHALNISELSLKLMREIVIDIRTNKLPDVKAVGTAGSFFKNPIISQEKYNELKIKYQDMPSFPAANNNVKIPAAWLLDKLCGFKGYRDGDVGVYQNQALVLVNFGNASAQDILSLAEKMIACVKEKTGIELEKEVQIIK